MRTTLHGITLIETLITIAMIAILSGTAVYVFQAILLSWSSQERRAGIDVSLDRGIEEMVRDLREAKEVSDSVNQDEIRFTHDQSAYYIYYLYNAGDSYPPGFSQETYELRRTGLTGGIGGVFSYGSGRIMITDILPPPTSDISETSNIITIYLSVKRKDETIRSKTKIRPRNL